MSSQDSIVMARRLAKEEGIYAASPRVVMLMAANKLAPELPGAKLIVTMINDTGMRYFSTPLFGYEPRTRNSSTGTPVSDADRENLGRRRLHIVR